MCRNENHLLSKLVNDYQNSIKFTEQCKFLDEIEFQRCLGIESCLRDL